MAKRIGIIYFSPTSTTKKICKTEDIRNLYYLSNSFFTANPIFSNVYGFFMYSPAPSL